MKESFEVKFLEEASEFLDNIDERAREKIIYNIRKAQVINDKYSSKSSQERFGNSEHYSTGLITDYLLSGTNLIEQILL